MCNGMSSFKSIILSDQSEFFLYPNNNVTVFDYISIKITAAAAAAAVVVVAVKKSFIQSINSFIFVGYRRAKRKKKKLNR